MRFILVESHNIWIAGFDSEGSRRATTQQEQNQQSVIRSVAKFCTSTTLTSAGSHRYCNTKKSPKHQSRAKN